jgi:hypothetical protein
MLRDTDVKKHLGRAAPRSVSPTAQDVTAPNHENGSPQAIPVPVIADVPEKVETA